MEVLNMLKIKQDCRLAPAHFSPNYESFHQFLQTVKNKTTVLLLVFKDFLQINSNIDFCTLCKRVSRFSLDKLSSHSAKQIRRGTLLCFRKFLLLKNVRDERGGCRDFPWKTFCLTVPKIFVGEPFTVSLILESENFQTYKGSVTIFYRKFIVSK